MGIITLTICHECQKVVYLLLHKKLVLVNSITLTFREKAECSKKGFKNKHHIAHGMAFWDLNLVACFTNCFFAYFSYLMFTKCQKLLWFISPYILCWISLIWKGNINVILFFNFLIFFFNINICFGLLQYYLYAFLHNLHMRWYIKAMNLSMEWFGVVIQDTYGFLFVDINA